MKRLILLLTSIMIFGASSFAQCTKNSPLFKFDNPGTAKTVMTLGANPQFTSLRNLSSTQQVAAALKKCSKQKPELDALLRDIGFANGAQDVMASNITSETIPAGTTGNMGDGKNNYSYVSVGSSHGWKAWKISSDAGGQLYILAKCGNAFYPGSGAAAAVVPCCREVKVAVLSDPKEITVQTPEVRTVKTYAYYKKGCSGKTSCPILIGQREVEANTMSTAAKYRVSLDNSGTARICTDDQGNTVVTNINIEKISGFSGYRRAPEKKEYKEVSKKEYKRFLRSGSCKQNCNQKQSCR